MPTTDLLTLILSIVAIVFAVVAIVFEVSFFVLQRNEARTLTKNVQDLVFQAVRNEKGIDQLSGQAMLLIERLVQARVSEDRAQTAPEVEKIVADLLMPVQESIAELDRRMKGASQSEGIKREMDEELEELDALRKQVSEVARQAAERTSRRPTPHAVRHLEALGEHARDLLGLVLQLHMRGGRCVAREIPGEWYRVVHAAAQAGEWELLDGAGDGIGLTPLGQEFAENLAALVQDSSTGFSVESVDRLWVEQRTGDLYAFAGENAYPVGVVAIG